MTRIQLRRGTAAQWTAANPVLASGEVGVEQAAGINPEKLKIGDGATAWADLPYSPAVGGGGTGTVTSISAANGTIVVGGTATAPTVAVGTGIPQASVTGLVAGLAGKEATIAAGTYATTQTAGVAMAAASVADRDALDVRVDALEAGGGAGSVTVLKWDHTTPQSVNHGRFWPIGVNLGPFWWECWCCPTAGATAADGPEYWISEGYGGAHAILAGFGGGAGPTFSLTGNVYNGTGNTSFGALYAAQNGEWLHYAVAWDGVTIFVMVNGIVCGTVPFAGPHRAQYGTLAIGGTDHSNFNGRIAQVRAWEGQMPTFYPQAAIGTGPDRYFADTWSGWPNGSGVIPAQFATSYLNAGDTFPDISGGWGGRLHPGHSYTGSGVGIDTVAPHPTRVVDPTAPFGNQYEVARTRTFVGPSAVPAGVKIYDSFGRADRTACFWPLSHTVALPNWDMGNTEGGSLGVQTWAHNPLTYGIFDNAAIFAPLSPAFARVANNSADMDVRVGRALNGNPINLYYVSAAVRINAARDSGWYAYTNKDYLGAVRVALIRPNGTTAGEWLPVSTTWTKLRVTTVGTTITVYVDDGAGGWTTLGSVAGETANQAEVGAGLYHTYGVGTAARYTDFEVR